MPASCCWLAGDSVLLLQHMPAETLSQQPAQQQDQEEGPVSAIGSTCTNTGTADSTASLHVHDVSWGPEPMTRGLNAAPVATDCTAADAAGRDMGSSSDLVPLCRPAANTGSAGVDNNLMCSASHAHRRQGATAAAVTDHHHCSSSSYSNSRG